MKELESIQATNVGETTVYDEMLKQLENATIDKLGVNKEEVLKVCLAVKNALKSKIWPFSYHQKNAIQ